MYDDENEQPLEARKTFTADPARLRRESRPETRVGGMVADAAAEADARVVRAIKGPPPSEAEQAIIAAGKREPARLFSKVLVADVESGEQERFTLVPHDEADLAAGKISIGSPIGRALLEEFPGAIVAVKAPGGKLLYRILSVE